MGSIQWQSDVLAEEKHASRVSGAIILAAMAGPALSLALAPSLPVRFALGVLVLIGFGAAMMAWSGFQYRFSPDGVEVRTAGFRLCSIPRQAILSYSIEPWSLLRGYGIRGGSGRRAYVWGNKVVHIRTTGGEIFLSHNDPERIVRDLDLVTGFVTRV